MRRPLLPETLEQAGAFKCLQWRSSGLLRFHEVRKREGKPPGRLVLARLAGWSLMAAWTVTAYAQPRSGEAPPDLIVEGQALGQRVEPRPNDFCLIDQDDLRAGDVVYLVRGQRVALHWPLCYQVFLERPREHLARLLPRGAFLGAGPGSYAISPAWFIFGLYVLLGLLFGALCAQRALHTGYRPLGWLGAGLLFNVFAYVWLRSRPPRGVRLLEGPPAGLRKFASTYSPRPCPHCGTANHPAASSCPGCGAQLKPAAESEVQKAGLAG